MVSDARHSEHASPSAGSGRIRGGMVCFFAVLVVTLAAFTGAPPADAQSLVHMYRSARYQALVQRVFAEHGRAARPMPPEPAPLVTDSMRAKFERIFPPPPPPEAPPRMVVRKWHHIPRLGRPWFERRFGSGGWSFLGSDDNVTSLDTTFTREIRARLESRFGSPTQTLADLSDLANLNIGDYIQFEYWFVLNDSIPLRVMDVNGPLERGVVVASTQQYRHLLPELRDLLNERLMQADRAPYADYYYLPEQKIWFITGFDGQRYFLRRVSKPNLRLGRPLLENVLDSRQASRN